MEIALARDASQLAHDGLRIIMRAGNVKGVALLAEYHCACARVHLSVSWVLVWYNDSKCQED